jgi:WbqC-like protein family
MSVIVSSYVPFPCISWWALVAQKTDILFDKAEHFQKMSYRNRYYIASANNTVILSIPLVHGRNQRCPMSEVQISNNTDWQTQHWRTLTAAYNRSPFFEYFAHSMKGIYEKEYTFLIDFNLDTISWVAKQLGLKMKVSDTDIFVSEYTDGALDIRSMKNQLQLPELFPQYFQVFADRNGFVPNLSIIDILFNEGPHTLQWLKEHEREIRSSMEV